MVLLIQLKGQLYREPGHLDPDSGPATDWIRRLSRPGPLCCLMAVQRGRDPRALSWAHSLPVRLTPVHPPWAQDFRAALSSQQASPTLPLGVFLFRIHSAHSRTLWRSHCMWVGVYLGSSVLRALVTAGTQREELITTADTS